MAYLIDNEVLDLDCWKDCGAKDVEAYGLDNLPNLRQDDGGRKQAQKLFNAKEFTKKIEINNEMLKEHIYFVDNKKTGKSEYQCLQTLRKRVKAQIEREYTLSRDRVLDRHYGYVNPDNQIIYR